MIQEAVDCVRDDMEEAMRNLHVDLLRQFQLQSREYSKLVTEQMAIADKLRDENEALRKENERLQQQNPR